MCSVILNMTQPIFLIFLFEFQMEKISGNLRDTEKVEEKRRKKLAKKNVYMEEIRVTPP